MCMVLGLVWFGQRAFLWWLARTERRPCRYRAQYLLGNVWDRCGSGRNAFLRMGRIHANPS